MCGLLLVHVVCMSFQGKNDRANCPGWPCSIDLSRVGVVCHLSGNAWVPCYVEYVSLECIYVQMSFKVCRVCSVNSRNGVAMCNFHGW